jgi:hypothetical protein
MRLGQIALRIRSQNTYFGDLVAGAVELDIAVRETVSLRKDMAFVVPLVESADPNEWDSQSFQGIIERFAVVVAVKNDTSAKAKTGLIAYDKLHDIRSDLFAALVNWQPKESKTVISFRGAKPLTVNNAYVFHQYEFEFEAELGIIEKLDNGKVIPGIIETEKDFEQDAVTWETLYTNFIFAPSARLPYTGDLPVSDNYPDVELPENAAQEIDMQNHPDNGAFWRGFSSAFDTYKGD